MNRNPERNEQDVKKDKELKDHLFSRIEIEWGKNRNDEIVDQLASEYPELAIELYEFFALLIDLEIDEESSEAEEDGDQAADEKIKNWLDKEGIKIALAAASAECKKTTTTTTPPTNSAPPNSTSSNLMLPKRKTPEDIVSEEIVTAPSGKVIPFETFPRKMRKKHGWGLKETSKALKNTPGELIIFAQNNQDKRYDPVRDEITDLYIELIGGDRDEIRESFNQPIGMVASTGTTIMKQNSYEEMIAKTKLTKSKKKFWLDLVADWKKEGKHE